MKTKSLMRSVAETLCLITPVAEPTPPESPLSSAGTSAPAPGRIPPTSLRLWADRLRLFLSAVPSPPTDVNHFCAADYRFGTDDDKLIADVAFRWTAEFSKLPQESHALLAIWDREPRKGAPSAVETRFVPQHELDARGGLAGWCEHWFEDVELEILVTNLSGDGAAWRSRLLIQRQQKPPENGGVVARIVPPEPSKTPGKSKIVPGSKPARRAAR